jgi:hypothetical protein
MAFRVSDFCLRSALRNQVSPVPICESFFGVAVRHSFSVDYGTAQIALANRFGLIILMIGYFSAFPSSSIGLIAKHLRGC